MQLDRYIEVFESIDELQELDKQALGEFVCERFDGTFEGIFSELKESMPEAFSALTKNYSAPKIGKWKVAYSPKPMYELFMQSNHNYLVGHFYENNFHELYQLDEVYEKLPNELHPYYSALQGLQFVTDGNPGIEWEDLPPLVSQAVDIIDYAKSLGYDIKSAKKMLKATPYNYLSTWLVLSSGSCLFTSANKGEHIYLVQDGDFGQFQVLKNPLKDISAYLAHILNGSLSKDYVFNQFGS